MSRSVTQFCALLWLASCAWSEPQGFTQIGNVLCQIPPGWQRAEQGGATVLVPPGVPQGKTAVLIILPGQTVQGDLRAWFDQQWTGGKADATVVEDSTVVAGTSAGGYEFIYTAARLQDAAKKVTFVFFFLAKAGEQAQPFAYMTDDETLVAARTAPLKTFLGTLTFVNLQPALPAAQPAGAPAGIGSARPSPGAPSRPPPATPGSQAYTTCKTWGRSSVSSAATPSRPSSTPTGDSSRTADATTPCPTKAWRTSATTTCAR